MCIRDSTKDMKLYSYAYQNWLSDVVEEIITSLYGNKIDLTSMNKGGIRNDMPKGTVSEGLISTTFPFDNRFMVLNLKGKDLLEAIRIMVGRGGDSVSKEVKVTYGANGKVLSAKLNGKDIKPEQTYKVGTINFLVNGGDGMGVLSKGTVLFTDTEPYGEHILNYVKNLSKQGKKISADEKPRFIKK